uniref:Uncharacterized protein n=1 Tax=Solanum lycopersicum TaxID=4081 RepID=A0A494G8G9_SOLLC
MSGVTCHFCPWKGPTLGGLRHGMPSSHLDSIYGWKTSCEACHHGRCPEHSVIIALVHHPRSYDFGRGMPAWPLGGTHCWMTSGVGCHHLLLTAYMVDDILRAIPSSPLDAQDVG